VACGWDAALGQSGHLLSVLDLGSPDPDDRVAKVRIGTARKGLRVANPGLNFGVATSSRDTVMDRRRGPPMRPGVEVRVTTRESVGW